MQTYDDIVIDPEFAAMIPPLAAEEREQLETNIVEHGGARDPLVVWSREGKLTILDGHNRYEICTRLGLPFDIHEMRFSDRDGAADWMDRNQKGRRNLPDFAKTELEIKREFIHASMTAPARRPKKSEQETTQKSEELFDRNDRTKDAKIGDAVGVSRDTVAKVRRITEAAGSGLVNDDTIAKLRRGAIEELWHMLMDDERDDPSVGL